MRHHQFLFIVLLFFATPVLAQIQDDSIISLRPDTIDTALLNKTLYETDSRDNMFYEFKIGVNYPWASNEAGRSPFSCLRPSVAFSFGKFFSPIVGVRGLLKYDNYRGTIKAADKGYSWHSAGVNADGLISFTNLLTGYKDTRRSDFIGYIGIGGIEAFGYSTPDWNANDRYYETDSRTFLTYRLGLIFHWYLNEKWDVSTEFSHNIYHDRFDGHVTNYRWDHNTAIMIGFVRHLRNHDNSYRFRHVKYDPSKFDPAQEEINRLRQQEEDLANRPSPVQDVQRRQVIVMVSFKAGSSEINKLQQVNVFSVKESLQHFSQPVRIFITSLSQSSPSTLFTQRATSIRDVLVDKYQVPSEQIVMEQDMAKVESLANSEYCVIVYVNETKE